VDGFKNLLEGYEDRAFDKNVVAEMKQNVDNLQKEIDTLCEIKEPITPHIDLVDLCNKGLEKLNNVVTKEKETRKIHFAKLNEVKGKLNDGKNPPKTDEEKRKVAEANLKLRMAAIGKKNEY
jgi:hypothetical protein